MKTPSPSDDLAQIQALPALVSILPVGGLFTAGVMTIKPNRVSDGTVYGIRDFITTGDGGGIGGALPVISVVVVVGVLLCIALIRRNVRRPYLLAWAVSLTIAPWVLIALGAAAAVERGELGGIARIVPAAGTWYSIVGAVAAWHEVIRSSGTRYVARVSLAVSLVAVFAFLLATPAFAYLAYTQEYLVRSARFQREALRHVQLAGTAVAMACVIGIPAGMLAFRRPRIRETILGITSTIQTIPSLAMFGLLIAPLAALSRAMPGLRSLGVAGVGAAPALIALTLYALLPVVRNTLTGLMMVPLGIRESGRAMGMRRHQQFWMVDVPLALPVVLRGVRTAAVQAVGNTTVAALIGAGGFGWFIFQGLGQAATDLVVLGVIPIVVLAIGVDRLFILLQRTT